MEWKWKQMREHSWRNPPRPLEDSPAVPIDINISVPTATVYRNSWLLPPTRPLEYHRRSGAAPTTINTIILTEEERSVLTDNDISIPNAKVYRNSLLLPLPRPLWSQGLPVAEPTNNNTFISTLITTEGEKSSREPSVQELLGQQHIPVGGITNVDPSVPREVKHLGVYSLRNLPGEQDGQHAEIQQDVTSLRWWEFDDCGWEDAPEIITLIREILVPTENSRSLGRIVDRITMLWFIKSHWHTCSQPPPRTLCEDGDSILTSTWEYIIQPRDYFLFHFLNLMWNIRRKLNSLMTCANFVHLTSALLQTSCPGRVCSWENGFWFYQTRTKRWFERALGSYHSEAYLPGAAIHIPLAHVHKEVRWS